MIIEDLKADLSEAAQTMLKDFIGQAVEKKLQKEMKKITKKLTVNFVITGVALLGAFTLINHSDKIAGLLTQSKD